jgi:hypothetical protein
MNYTPIASIMELAPAGIVTVLKPDSRARRPRAKARSVSDDGTPSGGSNELSGVDDNRRERSAPALVGGPEHAADVAQGRGQPEDATQYIEAAKALAYPFDQPRS